MATRWLIFLHFHALLLFTADILLSFSEHPPLKLPAARFVLDLENGPTDQSFDDYLEAIKKAINPGNDRFYARDVKVVLRLTSSIKTVNKADGFNV